jgi:hypothetical protein
MDVVEEGRMPGLERFLPPPEIFRKAQIDWNKAHPF